MSSHIIRCPSQWQIDSIKDGETIKILPPSFITRLTRKISNEPITYIKITYRDDKNNLITETIDQRDVIIVSKDYNNSQVLRQCNMLKTYKGKIDSGVIVANVEANVETISIVDPTTNKGILIATDAMRYLIDRIDFQIRNADNKEVDKG